MKTRNGSNRRPTITGTAAVLIGSVLACTTASLATDLPAGMTILDDFGPWGTRGMSPDGVTVIGSTVDGLANRPARWSSDVGIEQLGDHCGGEAQGTPVLITTNGTMFGVLFACAAYNGVTVIRWDAAGVPTILSGFSASWSPTLEFVSPDGSLMVGSTNPGGLANQGFRWTAGGGMTLLGDLPGGYPLASAFDSSVDASVIVGSGHAGDAFFRPIMWLDGSTTPVELPVLDPADPGGTATAVSADGSLIAGWAGDRAPKGFTWSESDGFTVIPNMPFPTKMAPDGSWILGYGEANAPLIYRPGIGTVSIDAWLAERGFEIPDAWASSALYISEISEDERSILAKVYPEDGDPFSFHYRLPDPCAGDLDGSGVVDFGDILSVLQNWGGAGGDVDGDGTTDFVDLLAVLSAWGPCPG